MNKLLGFLFAFLVLGCGTSCANDEPSQNENSNNTGYFGGKKTLIAYFS